MISEIPSVLAGPMAAVEKAHKVDLLPDRPDPPR